MCSSKIQGTTGSGYNSSTDNMDHQIRPQSITTIAKINGRPVLQPTCNRVVAQPHLRRTNSLKKKQPQQQPLPLISSPTTNNLSTSTILPSPKKTTSTPSLARTTSTRSLPSPPISPKNRFSPPSKVYSSNVADEITVPKTALVKRPTKKTTIPSHTPSPPPYQSINNANTSGVRSSLTRTNSSSCLVAKGPPGSIAEARRMEVANMQVMRKMKIAHYGRNKKVARDSGNGIVANDSVVRDDNKCYLITPTSDPIYVAYHDHEWAVPVQDDKLLFELLVLTSAQFGSNWTTILKKRQLLRDAFLGFDADVVSTFGEKKIASISSECGLEQSQVRAAVDNAKQILKMKEEFGSFSSYLWGYVNNKPMTTSYKACQKIPVKTSKSEAISKDLVKRGMRYVGATVVHSFMQATGLTNDHLISCPRHTQIQQIVSSSSTAS